MVRNFFFRRSAACGCGSSRRGKSAQRVAEERKISILEARDKIEQKDLERTAFIRKIFNKDVTSSANHDLVIHTGELRIESAVEIVLVAIQEKLGVSVAQSLRRAAA